MTGALRGQSLFRPAATGLPTALGKGTVPFCRSSDYWEAMDDLPTLVAAELAEPVDPRVAAMAAAIAADYPGAARAVLFYGSCLRESELDGLMLDFYLIVSSYRDAYGRGWFAFANSWCRPTCFRSRMTGWRPNMRC